jgi:hypothetical protein
MQRAGSGNGVAIRPMHDPTLLRAQEYGNRCATTGKIGRMGGNEFHVQQKKRPKRFPTSRWRCPAGCRHGRRTDARTWRASGMLQ